MDDGNYYALPRRMTMLAVPREDGIGIVAFGDTRTLSDWLTDTRCGVTSYAGFMARLRQGMSPTEAVESPRKRKTLSWLNSDRGWSG